MENVGHVRTFQKKEEKTLLCADWETYPSVILCFSVSFPKRRAEMSWVVWMSKEQEGT